jgi:uncharacterized repeat protein (TIGR01451 family)
MKKITFFAAMIISLAAFILSGKAVQADQYGCNGQYGNTCPPSQTILIDKMVSVPMTGTASATTVSYVDNLSSSDSKFRPGDAVFFRLKVKNTSTTTMTNVTVKDYIPSYIEPIEGAGSYDPNTRILTINAGDFQANEEKIYYFKAQIFPQNQLPADQGIVCIVNRARAYNDTVSSEDTAQFCVEKQVIGTPAVPATGPEFGLAIVGLEFAALAAGVYLRKRA